MKKRFLKITMVLTWLAATTALCYGVHAYRADMRDGAATVERGFNSVHADGREMMQGFRRKTHDLGVAIYDGANNAFTSMVSWLDVEPEKKPASPKHAAYHDRPGFIRAGYESNAPPPALTDGVTNAIDIEPSSGVAKPGSWLPDQPSIEVEAVLVPQRLTVISSSQTDRIAEIPVGHGDTFKKGDLLVAYDCHDLEAERDIVKIERDLTLKKAEGSDALFKLNIISDIDRLGALVEDRQAVAKSRLYDAKMQGCEIRAEFDGRVTNRLANAGEYTRTDRVLLEVASNDSLQAEFLIPSKWLRWVNVGAPLMIRIGETERTYPAHITRIHGEVDPVSQSIQMIALLDAYNDPLLPGMSGQAVVEIEKIRASGVRGYLETMPVSTRTN